jgi:polyisoprenyl-phosphate glycosyltransferase
MTSESSRELIVLTPVYEDDEASAQLFAQLHRLFGARVFVVAVDDGSLRLPMTDASLRAALLPGVVLKLKRNVGHQRAIAIGLAYIAEHVLDPMQAGQRVVVMDSDGEDRPETIDVLLSRLADGDVAADLVDVAVAQRKSRIESFRFKLFYAIYKRIFALLSGRPISFGNFMALKPHALKRLVAMQELPLHLASTVIASKLRIASCPIDRGARYAGQSKMNFVGLVLHGFKALMVFAEDVLVRVGIVCAVIASLSVVMSIAAITLKVIGISTPGWFSVALGILILMFLQTGALALMTLMLTGVVRGGAVSASLLYREFIEQVYAVDGHD